MRRLGVGPLAHAALLLALLLGQPQWGQAKVRWSVSRREQRSAGAKSRARVVVVLGTGCPAAAVDADLEAACGATLAGNTTAWRKAGKDSIVWKEPSPECAALPVLAGKSEREGPQWGFMCDYKLAYSRVFRQAADRLREIGWTNYQVQRQTPISVHSTPDKCEGDFVACSAMNW